MQNWPKPTYGSPSYLLRGRGQWEEKAFVSAEKALALDPDLAVAHLARGRLLWTLANLFPHEKAIREYRRALALNPSLDESRNQ
jgi:tetratricopeptide (TPR) repeat protein